MALTLRLKSRGGQHVLKQLDSSMSLEELKMQISKLTSIPGHALKILQGFPPRPLDLADGSQLLSSLSLRSGDTLIVEEDATAKAATFNAQAENLLQQIQSQSQHARGILTRKVVPANNSCLFTSIDLVIEERARVNLDSSKPMRDLIATVVASDPMTYNPAFLGKTNSSYCKWIRGNDAWGGAIEISILSRYYNVEIDVVDTQSSRIDRFGEDQNYAHRVLLIYDGIHYDPLILESLDPSNPSQASIFPTSDPSILVQAQEIAEEAKSSRQFTDVNQFTLRCLVCNTNLKGQTEAQDHAQKTGHINFGEC